MWPTAAAVRERADGFGDVLAAELLVRDASAQLRLLVLAGHDLEADQVASVLADDIERRGVRRLVIDSVAELQRGLGSATRAPDFLSALVSYLRAREFTTYLTLDVALIVGPALELAGTPLLVIAENLVLLRQVEYRGTLHRVVSVLKMRFSGYEPAIYEFTISPGDGLRVVGPAPLGEGVLTGIPRLVSEPVARAESTGDQGPAWPRS